jgi:hypothetical protein
MKYSIYHDLEIVAEISQISRGHHKGGTIAIGPRVPICLQGSTFDLIEGVLDGVVDRASQNGIFNNKLSTILLFWWRAKVDSKCSILIGILRDDRKYGHSRFGVFEDCNGGL